MDHWCLTSGCLQATGVACRQPSSGPLCAHSCARTLRRPRCTPSCCSFQAPCKKPRARARRGCREVAPSLATPRRARERASAQTRADVFSRVCAQRWPSCGRCGVAGEDSIDSVSLDTTHAPRSPLRAREHLLTRRAADRRESARQRRARARVVARLNARQLGRRTGTTRGVARAKGTAARARATHFPASALC